MAQNISPQPPMSLEQARTAVDEGLAELERPENKTRIEEAIAAAGGTPQGLMQHVAPVVLSINGPLLEKYGFSKDTMGIMQFITAVQMHAMSDAALNERVKTLRQKLLPGFP